MLAQTEWLNWIGTIGVPVLLFLLAWAGKRIDAMSSRIMELERAEAARKEQITAINANCVRHQQWQGELSSKLDVVKEGVSEIKVNVARLCEHIGPKGQVRT